MLAFHLNEMMQLELKPEPKLGRIQISSLLDRRNLAEVWAVNLESKHFFTSHQFYSAKWTPLFFRLEKKEENADHFIVDVPLEVGWGKGPRGCAVDVEPVANAIPVRVFSFNVGPENSSKGLTMKLFGKMRQATSQTNFECFHNLL